MNVSVDYIVATTDNLPQIDLSSYTKNNYEYRIYPRCKQTIKNPLKLFRTKIFDGCDMAFNLCGGDGYTDIYGFGRLMAESQLAWVAKMKGIPMIYSPQTIGPFQTKKGKVLAKLTLKKVKHIYVRDHSSYECCKALKISDKTTEVIDVAFALPYQKNNILNKKLKVGINVSGLLYNGGYNRKNYFGLRFDYKDFINRLLEILCSDKGIQVYLIAHVNSYDNLIEDDYRICKQLSEKYGCVLAPRFESPIEAKSYIAAMDIFSGARMHSTIAAMSSGVPVIPIAYSRKFNGLYSSLNYRWLIDAKADLTIDRAISLFLEYKDNIEELRKGVVDAQAIYKSKLNDYKSNLIYEIKKLVGICK